MDAAVTGARYRFGRFTLLPDEQRLLQDDREVAIGPRALEVLAVLVERAGQLVSKDVLLDAVWRGLVVEEANLHVQVSHLRKAIGSTAIATVPGHGYRFVAPLDSGTAPTRRLSVLVLPFVESAALPGCEDFADAITDDLTIQLARMPGSYVVASQTARVYKREPFDVKAEAQALGVRYVLHGRLDRQGGSAETHTRLVDAATGAVIWGEAFSLPETSTPNLRRAIVARLLNALTLELIKAEAAIASARPASQAPDPDDLMMQAGAIARTARSPQDLLSALAVIDQARELQPHRVTVLAYRARVLATLLSTWPGPDVQARIAEAERDIVAALAHDASNAHAHCTLSRVRHLQMRIGAALTAVGQAIELDPNFAEAVAWRGSLLVFNGQLEPGMESIRQALALAPRDPHRWGAFFWLGKIHVLSGRYEEAIPWLENSAAIAPFWATQAFLAAANAHLGRSVEMQAALDALRCQGDLVTRSRGLRLSDNPLYLRLRREHYIGGLVKAGAIPDASALD